MNWPSRRKCRTKCFRDKLTASNPWQSTDSVAPPPPSPPPRRGRRYYYFFFSPSSHKLILAVGDISGKGISAALLIATIHSAVRAYSVENLPQMREPVAVGAVSGAGRVMATWPEGVEVSPGALLSLLNHQLYESTPLEKYATLFLGIYDGRSHHLTYSNGGHLPPILISKDGTIRRLEAGGTVV